MGEIGISRDVFFNQLTWWEIHSIIRGYRKRDRLKHQLMAECTYAAMFMMRDPKGKTAADIFPGIFDNDEDEEVPMTEEDRDDLQDIMAAEQARLIQEYKEKSGEA